MKLRRSPLIIDAPRRNDAAARQGQCLPVRRFLVAGPSNRGRSETRVAQLDCGTRILRWGVGRRGGGPATAERRQGLLLPKPGSGVHFGGAFLAFLLPWLAGGPPGASGPPLCRLFTVQRGRIGVPHGNRATWVSNVPRFCGPAVPKPRAAREPDDLDPQWTDKIRQIRRTRLQFLDSVSLFAAWGVESP